MVLRDEGGHGRCGRGTVLSQAVGLNPVVAAGIRRDDPEEDHRSEPDGGGSSPGPAPDPHWATLRLTATLTLYASAWDSSILCRSPIPCWHSDPVPVGVPARKPGRPPLPQCLPSKVRRVSRPQLLRW